MYSTIAPSLGESHGVPSSEAPRSSPQASTLSGSVERIVYFDDETGQCVLDLKDFESKEHILVSGRLPFVYPGQTIDAELTDLDPYNTGLRQAKKLILSPPANERALRKFLKSEAFDEMGPHLAKSLAKAFPGNFFNVLSENPDPILEIQGVGKKKQKQIIELWKDFRSFTEFKTFLFENSLPLDWARSIWASHGRDSLSYFSKNPYETVVKYLFPFEIVDIYALNEGFERESFSRIRSCLFDLLQNHYRQGHCAYPQNKLVDEALGSLDVKPELIEEALELEVVEDNMVSDYIGQTECIYLKEIWEQERNVAQKLLKFENKTVPWGMFNMPKAMDWAQTLLGMQLAPLQKQAIETALNSPLTIITGGPGTGKTTLIRSLVTILKTQSSNFVLCSPTGRAAQRLEEATGHQAQTIHRLLKYDGMTGTFGYNPSRPLEVDLVLIDEVSMVDLSLMSHLLDALPPHCALILVGDADQIPSVGAGNVLQSLIASERFNTVRLKEIFRTKVESAIRINAHRINSGEMPHEVSGGSSDFHFIPAVSVEETKKVITELVTDVIPNRYGIKDPSQLQILVPLNKGALGTQQLNLELKELFSASPLRRSISGFGQSYKVGDKIMVVKNDYKKGVFNGDIGFIEDIDPIAQYVDILFDDRSIRFGFEELSKIHLAYAISIHKSQGSEYRAVIVVISKEHLPMAQRHLIYTAVTRGKEQVFLVADPAALQTAVLSDENNCRWQKLTELLEKNRIN
jgi:exodeoxyribonuclease V alpha subunit